LYKETSSLRTLKKPQRKCMFMNLTSGIKVRITYLAQNSWFGGFSKSLGNYKYFSRFFGAT
jgi:hypothetical protein